MKTIKLISILLIGTLLNVSCIVDDGRQELEEDFATTPYVVGFKNSSSTTSFLTDGSTQLFEQPIDLISGGNFSNTPEITVAFQVDPSSTAIAGTDYDFVSGNGTATIPANRDFGIIGINVYTDNIDVSNPKTIILTLVNTSLGVIGDNGSVEGEFETVTINLGGVCFSDAAGTFDIMVTRSTGQVYNFTNEVITQIGDALYLTQSTGRFSDQPGGFDITAPPNNAERNGFTFTENCGVITIDSQPLGDTFGGNPVSGSGSLDEFGNMTMTITVGGDSTYNVVYTKL
ncbi:MAG: hypothetical protein R2797_10730 [Gelidibacter sp.]